VTRKEFVEVHVIEAALWHAHQAPKNWRAYCKALDSLLAILTLR